jgi:PPOX class probable F420-dependent enzyme
MTPSKKISPECRAFLLEGAPTAKLGTVRANGQPHIAPIWFALDGDTVVFTTSKDTVKGKNMLRDPRVTLCVDDERPPFSFAIIEGLAEVIENAPDLLKWTTILGGRYMGEDQAEVYGKRNAVPGECLVRVTPAKVLFQQAIASFSA